MILYFSATGNCKYVASRLRAALEQEAVSIVDCMQRGEYSFTGDQIGIVSPTYFWGLPSIVKELSCIAVPNFRFSTAAIQKSMDSVRIRT